LINLIVILYVVLRTFPFCTLADFQSNVELVLLGDDNVIGVSDLWASRLDFHAFMAYGSEVGITYTSSFQGFASLAEVSFIGYKFGLRAGFYWPVPDALRVKSSLVWSTKTKMAADKTLLRLCAATINSYGDPDLYSIIKQARDSYISLHQELLTHPDWLQLKAACLNDDQIHKIFVDGNEPKDFISAKLVQELLGGEYSKGKKTRAVSLESVGAFAFYSYCPFAYSD